ncbi:hypothetical protein PXH66_21500 [Synoicihabitans lomoniglobus]|uniref:Uncharacterized protein n=2 Tax=Synoicihabitans lomoniglobus TaxID=2909285 RepID=A0AAE9ZWW7_9BACT|nr:hypothetical protein PXH66_21500 [Opitutaceae bacterium LMO-M01]
MKLTALLSKAPWWIPPLAVIALVWWSDCAAMQRIDYVSGLHTQDLHLTPDDGSVSGFAGGRRRMIIPAHSSESFEWVVQTQRMQHQDVWRLKQVDYDNAPTGRAVESPSAYRWWLATVANFAGDASSAGGRIENAALIADPVLHMALILGVAVFVGWQWGGIAAGVAAILTGLALPVLASYYPGVPGDRGLATALVAASALPLLAGIRSQQRGRNSHLFFAVAGLANGLLLWVSVHRGVPMLIGSGLGGLFAAWLVTGKTNEPSKAFPWWTWAVTGAVAVVSLYLLEYAPDRLDWKAQRLHQAHPLYAVAWLGGAVLCGQVQAWLREGKAAWTRRNIAKSVGGLIVVAAIPVIMRVTGQSGFLGAGTSAQHLGFVPGLSSASSFSVWLKSAGGSAAFWSLALPLGFVAAALWHLMRKSLAETERGAIGAAFVFVLVGLGFAIVHLSWWCTVGVLVAILTALLIPALPRGKTQWIVAALALASVLPGAAVWGPQLSAETRQELTQTDAQSLVERHLAHWLSTRTDEYHSVVLAPPELTPSLYYYGGVRGLGSPYRENEAGFVAGVRIASATSPDESFALATQRELSHIIMPSWDDFLDEYARLGAVQVEHTMVAMLHNWLPPRWLRPVHVALPNVEPFDALSAVVFEVVETQDNATALSRLGVYFAETKQTRFASAIAQTLTDSFPSDLGGLVAQAQIAAALSNRPRFEAAIRAIIPYVEEERDGDLLWDRRVNLANVLMLGQQEDYAREQVQYCMDEVDDYWLKSVSVPTLFRFIILCRSLDEPFPEPELETAAINRLPAAWRERL